MGMGFDEFDDVYSFHSRRAMIQLSEEHVLRPFYQFQFRGLRVGNVMPGKRKSEKVRECQATCNGDI
jgi:hypothetical protein